MKKSVTNVLKKLLAICLAAAMVIPATPSITAYAADTVTLDFTVKYLQTDARTEEALINEFRQGDDAWYWNSDNTQKTTCSDLGTLTWDYNLEKVCMQRAAEIAISYSHTRPNGNSYYTAYSEFGYSYSTAGENIAAGYGSYTTAASVFTGWREDDKDYNGQGHRRNMLSSLFTRFASAGVYYNGSYYWVQEFACSTSSNTATAANDSDTAVQVSVLTSNLTTVISCDADSIEVTTGKTAELPAFTTTAKTTGSWPGRTMGAVNPAYTYTIADTSVASLNNGVITGLKAGTTTLTVSALNTTKDITIAVADPEHVHTWDAGKVTTESTCTAEGVKTYTCSGCGLTKTESIDTIDHTWDDGTIVTEPTCAAKGIKKITCTVCGSYYYVTIAKTSNHTWDAGTVTKAATCGAAGVKTYTCSVCGSTKTEEIPKLSEHTWDNGEVTTAATCQQVGVKTYTCSICGSTKTEEIAKTDHNYQLTSTERTSCDQAGTAIYTCSVCGNQKTETLPAGTHAWDGGTVTKPATCTTNGVKTYTCGVCGSTKTENIAATGVHTWDGGKVTKAATCTAAGIKTYTCSVCGSTKTENIAAIGHSPADPVRENEIPATYTAAGSYDSVVYCSTCGEELSRTTIKVPMLVQNDIAGAVVSMDDQEFYYTGDEWTPSVYLKMNGQNLYEGVDYTVDYLNNINAGKAEILITGMGDYIGNQTVIFTIEKADQDDIEAVINDESDSCELAAGETSSIIVYNGYGDITFESDDESIAAVDEDGLITGVSAGQAAITITASGDENHNAVRTYVYVTVNDEQDFTYTDVTTGKKIQVDFYNEGIYRFIPTKSGYYEFKSSSNCDPYISIYDAALDQVGFYDDMDLSTNRREFDLLIYLNAGEIYYAVPGVYISDESELATDKVAFTIYAQNTIPANGMFKSTADNCWYYTTDYQIDYTYTGMAKNQYGWWYISKGKLDLTYTGMAKNQYGWWYMTKGKLDLTYTGMAKNQYGWWYITKGKLNTTYTGLAKNAYGTWYFKNGKIQTGFTGKVKINGKTYNIKKGKVV